MTMLRSLLLAVALLRPVSATASPADQLAVGMTEQQVLQIMKNAGMSYWGFQVTTCGTKAPPVWTCKWMRFQAPLFSWSLPGEIWVWFQQPHVDEWWVHSWEDEEPDGGPEPDAALKMKYQ